MGLHLRERAGSRRHDLAHRVVESVRPVEATVLEVRIQHPEVVHDVAARDHEHVALAQRREARAQIEVVFERLHRVDRELHHRDVGSRERVAEHRPGAVVETPAVLVETRPHRRDHFGDLLRERGVARRRVLHPEELLREAEEVVNGRRVLHRGECRRVDVPMGRDHDDAAWPPDRCAERPPALRVAVVPECVHRCAVTQERSRHQV